MKKVEYTVPALYPGEQDKRHSVTFDTSEEDVDRFVLALSFYEYPKGDGTNVRAFDIVVKDA